MLLRITFQEVNLINNIHLQNYDNVIKGGILPSELHKLELTVDGKRIAYTTDPEDPFVVLVDIPTKTIEQCKNLKVYAEFCDNDAGDYNEDYNDDYQIGNQPDGDFNNDFNEDFHIGPRVRENLVVYENEFTIFGYDLGNNRIIDHNPHFVISFVTGLPDFNSDFNWDFKYQWQTYSDGIAYRKPFTNEVLYYDSTSSSYEHIKWEYLGQTSTTRNGSFCSDNPVEICVTKDFYEDIFYPDPDPCNCGCFITKKILSETYTNKLTVCGLDNHFSNYEIVASNALVEHCGPNCIADTLLTTYLDKPKKTYWVNDTRQYPYELERVTYQLFDGFGTKLLDKSGYSLNLNTENWIPKEYQFNLGQLKECDYKAEVTFNSYNYCGELLRQCKIVEEFRSNHYVNMIKNNCGDYKFHNCSIDPVDIQFFKFKIDKFEKIDEVELSPLENRDFQFEDGIYKIVTDTNPTRHKAELYLVITCNLELCLSQVINELTCNAPCDNKEDFTQFNAITTLSTALFQKVAKLNYINSDFIDALPVDDIAHLETIDSILDKLDLYCYSCLGIKLNTCKEC